MAHRRERIVSSILTPISLWKNFDDNLPLLDSVTDISTHNGITFERVRFSGRDAGDGRVVISGMVAYAEDNAAEDGVLIIPDSRETIDEGLLELFAKNGYIALMVDIRGEWEGQSLHTVYPRSIEYANYAKAGRRLNYVDDSADKTAWYEWVAVGLYARKYLKTRFNCAKIGVVGIRDGGEVAWKLAYAGEFACAVPVCAGGWRSYSGCCKFGGEEPEFNEERHRFIAAVDSQAYAPYVGCPILMLCSTNDPAFDYDRAYDTFSRINPKFISDSVIAYSIKSNACIGMKSVKDMFMFLDKFVKERQVFISKPAELSVCVDENSNLVAHVDIDGAGEIEQVGVFMAEDCINPTMRDWMRARPVEKDEDCRDFFLDIYEKTTILFAICYVTYTNGFTVWSKITVKKLSGAFRNSCSKSRVMYSSRSGSDCFSLADYADYSIAKTFFVSEDFFPRVVERGDGLKGIYSPCGLCTYRLNSPRFMPSPDSLLKFDIYAVQDCELEIVMTSVDKGVKYSLCIPLIGGMWQNVVAESILFKNSEGMALASFSEGLMLTIKCTAEYAVNNVMWL